MPWAQNGSMGFVQFKNKGDDKTTATRSWEGYYWMCPVSVMPEFSCLAVAQEKWFRMTPEQCQWYIRKFNKASIHHATESSAAVDSTSVHVISDNQPCSLSMDTAGQLSSATCISLSVLLDEAVSKVDLPYTYHIGGNMEESIFIDIWN